MHEFNTETCGQNHVIDINCINAIGKAVSNVPHFLDISARYRFIAKSNEQKTSLLYRAIVYRRKLRYVYSRKKRYSVTRVVGKKVSLTTAKDTRILE